MRVHINITNQVHSQKYTFNESLLNIHVSEMDFVDFEIEKDDFTDTSKLNLIIGNTPFILDEPIIINDIFFYRVNLNYLSSLLPGNYDAHLSSNRFETVSGQRRFARIFINEIGLSKIYVRENETETHVANFFVETSKLSTENYELITLYLISTGYFDSNIIYKAVIEGNQHEIKNTLLEALRELLKRLKKWKTSLPSFKFDPITKYTQRQSIVSYSSDLSVDEDSLDWLADNISTIRKISINSNDIDFIIKANAVKIDSILLNELHNGFDSYENKIINGFILSTQSLLMQLSSEIDMQIIPRTRITTFKSFLISCFNNLIAQTLTECKDLIYEIHTFYQKELPSSSPIYGFPDKVDGFYKKQHYQDVLNLINYLRKFFNIDLNINNFSLEIESFDKLFEIYCFYIIKDTISNKFFEKQWTTVQKSDDTNKLRGRYKLEVDNYIITIHYEDLPDEFIQYSKSRYAYKPDFVINLAYKNKTYYVILDAKYKNYNNEKLQSDLSKLTLNYLHKIGVPEDGNNVVIGLFTISLSPYNSNKLETIFKSEFSISGNIEQVVLPQIGNIELMPKHLSISSNPFISLIDFMIQISDSKSESMNNDIPGKHSVA